MTDPSRRGGWEEEHPGTYSYPVEPGETHGQRRSYGSGQQRPVAPEPTQQLPAYSPYGYGTGGPPGPPGSLPPEPPEPPDPRGGSRTWLWVLAGGALLLVLGLILSLFIDSSSQEPMGSPTASPIEPTITAPSTTTTTAPTTTRRPTATATPSSTTAPPGGSAPGAMHTVVYTVQGEGRAINIVYLDSGGILQTEFNVSLPWSKEVQLAGQANSSASVSVINFGRQVTCSIDVDGVLTQQTAGTGFTLCTSLTPR